MKTFLILLFLLSTVATPSSAQVWNGALDQLFDAGPSLVTVVAEFKFDLGQMAQMMGMDDSTLVVEQSGTGIIVNPHGVILVSQAMLSSPSLPRMGPNRRHDAVRSKITVRLGKDRFYQAKVIEENKSLGVAFLAIHDPKGAIFKAVDLNADGMARLGDELLCIGRLNERFGFALKASRIHLAGAIAEPVAAFLQQGCDLNGACVYNAHGQFIGFAVETPKADIKDDSPFASLKNRGAKEQLIVILPARVIRGNLPKIQTSKAVTGQEEAKKEERKHRKRRPMPTERDLNDLESDYDANARRAAPRDSFPVFDNPKMSTAKEAKTASDEAVIGVVCDGEARAYPISIMGVHELGNDVCGKTPIAVSW